MKWAVVFGVFVFALILVVLNYSSVETRYKCSGEVTSNAVSRPQTLFLKIELYRWWVGLWGDSDGAVWSEIPQEITGYEYFPHVSEIGNQLQIRQSKNGNLLGHFSALSQALTLETVPGLFEGMCEKMIE